MEILKQQQQEKGEQSEDKTERVCWQWAHAQGASSGSNLRGHIRRTCHVCPHPEGPKACGPAGRWALVD